MKFNSVISLFLLAVTILIGCTQQVDTGTTDNSNTTVIYSGGGTSDPNKPTYTPLSPTGDTTHWHPHIDSVNYNFEVIPTISSQCADTNTLVTLTLTGKTIPQNVQFEWYFGD